MQKQKLLLFVKNMVNLNSRLVVIHQKDKDVQNVQEFKSQNRILLIITNLLKMLLRYMEINMIIQKLII